MLLSVITVGADGQQYVPVAVSGNMVICRRESGVLSFPHSLCLSHAIYSSFMRHV